MIRSTIKFLKCLGEHKKASKDVWLAFLVFRKISQTKVAFVIEKMFIDTCIKELSIRVGSAERGISFCADSVKAKLCIDFHLNLRMLERKPHNRTKEYTELSFPGVEST